MRPSILTDKFFDCLESSVLPLEESRNVAALSATQTENFMSLRSRHCSIMNGYALAESQTFQTRAIFSPHTLWTSQLSSLETRAGK